MLRTVKPVRKGAFLWEFCRCGDIIVGKFLQTTWRYNEGKENLIVDRSAGYSCRAYLGGRHGRRGKDKASGKVLNTNAKASRCPNAKSNRLLQRQSRKRSRRYFLMSPSMLSGPLRQRASMRSPVVPISSTSCPTPAISYWGM